MIAMLDTSEDLTVCERELGCPVEQLFTPLTRFSPQRAEAMGGIDNGAFAGFDEAAFLALLEREKPRRQFCRFVCCPDVVGSAIRTLELFDHWEPRLRGWPVALVLQDGQENFPIPWHSIDAVFVGGTTAWKMGPFAIHCIRAAQALGKWVHAGRVNTPGRFEHFEDLGVNSIDGSGLARYSHMRQKIYQNFLQPKLFDAEQP